MRSLHLHQYYCNYSKKPNKRADSRVTISEKWIMFKYDKSLPSFLKSIESWSFWHEISNCWSVYCPKYNPIVSNWVQIWTYFVKKLRNSCQVLEGDDFRKRPQNSKLISLLFLTPLRSTTDVKKYAIWFF